jgi:ribose 5-phosphate isomerase B
MISQGRTLRGVDHRLSHPARPGGMGGMSGIGHRGIAAEARMPHILGAFGMRLIIGSDHLGRPLKDALVEHLRALGHDVDDAGTLDDRPVDYPDVARVVAEDVARHGHERGILICGTGIGMAISANKVPGIRAAQIADAYSAERAAKSNDAQIVTLGALTTGVETAKLLVEAYLRSEFAGGRSAPKVAKMNALDDEYRSRPAT